MTSHPNPLSGSLTPSSERDTVARQRRRSFMLGFANLLHSLLGLESVWAYALVTALAFRAVGGGLGILTGLSHRKEVTRQTEQQAAARREQEEQDAAALREREAAAHRVQRTREMYSSRQSIRWIGRPGAPEANLQLNLDNVATLLSFMPPQTPPQPSRITLHLQIGGAGAIANPTRDGPINLPFGNRASFPSAGISGAPIVQDGIAATHEREGVTFDTAGINVQRVRVGDRTFVVRLDRIVVRTQGRIADFECVFGINEE